jgi:16S rRNA G966 N2-methylase RsmD
MFHWNNKNIEWFIKSSKYSSFHKNLAEIIIPYIEYDSTIIDIGAGLGCLDQELSKYCKKITLIEPNKDAYDFLIKNEKPNFDILNTTYEKYSLEKKDKHDYLLLSFFSRMDTEDNYHILSKLCSKKIIYVRNEGHGSNEKLIKYLNERSINYTFTRHEIDFSQPLQFNEIDDFIDTYYGKASTEEKKKLKKRVIKKDDFYLFNNIKRISIFLIET